MTSKLGAFRERLLRSLGMTHDRPPVDLDIGPLLRVGVLRLVTAALAVVLTLAVARDSIIWVGGVIAVILLLLLPRPIWPPILVLLFGIGLLTDDTSPIRTAVVVFASHLLIVLCTLLGRMPWGGLVELRALLRPLVRFGIIQVFAQGLALLGFWLTVGGVTIGIVAVTVAILLAVATWVLAWRLRIERDADLTAN